MENKIINDKALDVFVIIAETLAGWKNLISDEGKEVLKQHYNWATDFELTSTNKINPIGHTTGLIMLKAKLREEAEEWAFKDPFHINGFRKNVVHSMKITMTDNLLFEPLEQLIK